MIVKIEDSPLKMKRFRITMDNGKTYDFGLKGGSTYVDHADDKKKSAYQKRHLGNTIERQLIENKVPSPSYFSYSILWGKYPDIQKNIKYVNSLWKK